MSTTTSAPNPNPNIYKPAATVQPAQPQYTQQQSTPVVNRPIFDQVDQAVAQQSRFVKIVPGQSVVLYFDVDRIRIVDREINGKKSKGVEYDVIDVNTGAEKTLTLSLSWSRQLNEFLKAGYRAIRVMRRGSGFDTQYTFMPT